MGIRDMWYPMQKDGPLHKLSIPELIIDDDCLKRGNITGK